MAINLLASGIVIRGSHVSIVTLSECFNSTDHDSGQNTNSCDTTAWSTGEVLSPILISSGFQVEGSVGRCLIDEAAGGVLE